MRDQRIKKNMPKLSEKQLTQAEEDVLQATRDPILQQMLDEERVEMNELDTQLLWRLIRYVKPHKWLAFFATLMALLEACFMTLPAWFIGLAIDKMGSTQERTGSLVWIIDQTSHWFATHFGSASDSKEAIITYFGLIIAISFILRWLIAVITSYSMQKLGQKVIHDIRVEVYTHLTSMDMSFFQKNPLGRLVNRTIFDVQSISELFADAFAQGIRDILFIIVLMIVMLSLDVPLALTLILAFPILILIALMYRKTARPALRTTSALLSRMNSWMAENISGMRENQLYNRENRRRTEFRTLTDAHQLSVTHLIRAWAFLRPLMMMTSVLATACVLIIGYWRVDAGIVSIGILLTFVQYTHRLWQPVRNLTEKYNLIQNALTSGERVMTILDERSAMFDSPDSSKEVLFHEGAVTFENVHFAYPSKPKNQILKDISFTMTAGQKLALVGDTGSGKTTIIHLISRFYDVDQGRVLIDGLDVKEITLSQLRRRIALVPQDVVIFAGSIRENITMGLDVDDQVLHRCLQAVCADKIVSRFADGLEHILEESGRTLSTGERQLLSFARALVFNPPLLILDEATANVDTETERIIQGALAELTHGRSSIVIAHRLSTIRDADMILVLKSGEIIESGDHEELMRRDEEYARLIRSHMMKSPQDDTSR